MLRAPAYRPTWLLNMLELITLPYARPRWSGLLRQLFEDYQENAVPLEIPVLAGGLADSIH